MSDTIEVQFRLTKNDVIAASNMVYHRLFLKRTDIYLILAGLIIGIFLWIYKYILISLYIIGFSSIALAVIVFYYYLIPTWIYKRRSRDLGNIKLNINTDGLNFITNNAESKINWSYYYKAWELDNYYLLFNNKDNFTILPRSAFTTEVDDKFRQLLSSKVKEGLIRV